MMLRRDFSISLKRGMVADETELVGIGGVNSAKQRLGDPLQGFAAKTTPDKGAETFIDVGIASRHQQFRRHAQFPAPRKQRCSNEGSQLGRRQQEKTFRQGHELAVMNDIDLLMRSLGRHQTRSQSEPFTEAQRPGFFRDERIRSGLDEKIADSLRRNAAAEAIGRLKQKDLEV